MMMQPVLIRCFFFPFPQHQERAQEIRRTLFSSSPGYPLRQRSINPPGCYFIRPLDADGPLELVNYCFDSRYADIMSSRSGLYPREPFHRLMVFLSSKQLNLMWSGSLVSWIPDSNLQQDSGFLVLDSGFQSPGFRIPQAKNSWIPESGFPYMGRLLFNNRGDMNIVILFFQDIKKQFAENCFENFL